MPLGGYRETMIKQFSQNTWQLQQAPEKSQIISYGANVSAFSSTLFALVDLLHHSVAVIIRQPQLCVAYILYLSNYSSVIFSNQAQNCRCNGSNYRLINYWQN